ncbi:MAG: medium chain dehydrogenase/reductase family protein [Myxococcota bacterium]
MRAVTITKHGAPSVLKVLEHPDPEPQAGEIRVEVKAAGLNFAEVSARQGLYPDAPKPPCVVGYEVAGLVDKVGAGVTKFAVGDRVLAMTRFGGHASSVVVKEAFAFKMPAAMSYAEGAALPVNYLTAHHMLFQIGTVHPNSTLLIHMAAGGVGTAVLQLVQKIPGLVTIGTASASKHDYLRKLGCTHAIDYRTQDYVEEVKKLTNGRGADLILDALGGEDWKKSWALLAPAGRMVAFGFANGISGSKLSMFRVMTQAARMLFVTPLSAMDQNKSLQGCNMGHLWDEAQLLTPQIARLIELYEQGIVRPHVDAEVPFEQAAEAHEMLEGRKNKGKVVLVP